MQMNGFANNLATPYMDETLRLMKDRQEAAAALNNRLQKEMNDHKLATSYQDFRVRYLRALGKLRPAEYEDKPGAEGGNFLQTLRRQEKKKKVRYDELKAAWLFFDSVAIDKPDVLSTEDQRIENQLDEIEVEIHEEWQEFAEEVICRAEETGIQKDPDVMDWKLERKELKKDLASIKKRKAERDEMRKKAEVRRIEEIVRARRGESGMITPPEPVSDHGSDKSLRTRSKSSKEKKDKKDKKTKKDKSKKKSNERSDEDNAQDKLLEEVFPPHIAKALREGRKIEPESKEVVTIFFSDIVGFTNISSSISPLKVSDMLDRLYQRFDKLSHDHDVFKVETIGDSWMGATNLTKDQPDHAQRVARFAIDALQAARETYIDEDNKSLGTINLRVGFHSGPVVANVVGSRNPRYCLFGDTVNTASRMESNSKPGRIQCSDASAAILKQCGEDLTLHSRGKIDIKGKGLMETFFVGGDPIEEEPQTTAPSSPDPAQEMKDDAGAAAALSSRKASTRFFGAKKKSFDSAPDSQELIKEDQEKSKEESSKKGGFFGMFRKSGVKKNNRRASLDTAPPEQEYKPATPTSRRASIDSAGSRQQHAAASLPMRTAAHPHRLASHNYVPHQRARPRSPSKDRFRERELAGDRSNNARTRQSPSIERSTNASADRRPSHASAGKRPVHAVHRHSLSDTGSAPDDSDNESSESEPVVEPVVPEAAPSIFNMSLDTSRPETTSRPVRETAPRTAAAPAPAPRPETTSRPTTTPAPTPTPRAKAPTPPTPPAPTPPPRVKTPSPPAPRESTPAKPTVRAATPPPLPTPPPVPSGPKPKINEFLEKAIDALEASKGGPGAITSLNDIYEIVKMSDERQKEFDSGRGAAPLIKVWKKFEGNEIVLESVLRLMTVLSKTNVNRDTFTQHGVVDLILKAMSKNPLNVQLQQFGCDSLAGLAETPKYQDMIVSSNGIEVIMAAQKAHLSSGEVQVTCFRALRCLAKGHEDYSATIAAAGGIWALMEILQSKSFPLKTVIELHVESFRAMAEFARLNSSNRGSIAAAGGIPKLIGGMSCFSKSADLLGAGVDALYCLSIDHEQNCDTIVAYDGINSVMKFMKKKWTHPVLQESGLLLLTSLLNTSATAAFRVPGDCAEFVEESMEKNPDNERLQKIGKNLISVLNE